MISNNGRAVVRPESDLDQGWNCWKSCTYRTLVLMLINVNVNSADIKEQLRNMFQDTSGQ